MSWVKESEPLKISFRDIQIATNDFQMSIGGGGFGKVYKGQLFLFGSSTTVAVKRLDNRISGQGVKEFLTEIQMLSSYKHKNLISLLGFCEEGNERILVYEHAKHGSLDNYLSNYSLPWTQRLEICLGAAQGLDYLHNRVGEHHRVIHRDIKSANILLDENQKAKIADFGLSKISLVDGKNSLIITNACGSLGYWDLAYITTGKLTKESDVYSFGVVLFEVLCGRLAFINTTDNDRRLLGPLAKRYYENTKIEELIDSFLLMQMVPASMGKLSEIANKCLHMEYERRPSMNLVVQELEAALKFQVHSGSQQNDPYVMTSENCTQNGITMNDEGGGLKKLDSFGRWMEKEMVGDCEDSLMTSDFGNYWNETDTPNEENEGSSLSRHMQLNIDSVGPSISGEQLFSICDFAPDWAYSGVETKVLITGTFLGDKKHSLGTKWSCMFGEIEVSAEVVMDHAIRCQVPSHAAGRVPFFITCSNRLACSEVREFKYLKNPSRIENCSADKIEAKDESNFLFRLAKMLSSRLNRKWLHCSMVNCEKCKLKGVISSLENDKERTWRRITEASRGNYKELVIQNLLKDKLYEWLLCEVHEGCQGLHFLDKKGQGVIHLAAALGYEWAIPPIFATGVGINIRDLQGRTALHWASLYGREETVVKLVKLGAFAGAVDDPTHLNPGRQT